MQPRGEVHQAYGSDGRPRLGPHAFRTGMSAGCGFVACSTAASVANLRAGVAAKLFKPSIFA